MIPSAFFTTNAAMTLTTQFDQEQMLGKSLADLEAWTPEFLKMVLGFTSRGSDPFPRPALEQDAPGISGLPQLLPCRLGRPTGESLPGHLHHL